MIKNIMSNNTPTIFLDVSEDKVLGSFGKNVYLHTEDIETEIPCILQIPEKVYIKEWKKWLAGKRAYCERNKYFCGVCGNAQALDVKLIGTDNINEWNEDEQVYKLREVNVYRATKFDINDFEHG